MYEAFHLTENRDLMMNSILYEYLYLLTSKFPQKNILLEEKQQSYVEETLKYIENNYYHTCNIQDIADTLNLERTYLYRLFKNKTGFSMQEYLIDYRIRKACDLLRKTTLLISDIARSVGYEDSLYFSKLFKAKRVRLHLLQKATVSLSCINKSNPAYNFQSMFEKCSS